MLTDRTPREEHNDAISATNNCRVSKEKVGSAIEHERRRDDNEKYDDRQPKRPRLTAPADSTRRHTIFLLNLDYGVSEREIGEALSRKTSAKFFDMRCLIPNQLAEGRKNNGVCIVHTDNHDEESRGRLLGLNGKKFLCGKYLTVVDSHWHENTVSLRSIGNVRNEQYVRDILSGCKVDSMRWDSNTCYVVMEDEESVVRALEKGPRPDRIAINLYDSRSNDLGSKRWPHGFRNGFPPEVGFGDSSPGRSIRPVARAIDGEASPKSGSEGGVRNASMSQEKNNVSTEASVSERSSWKRQELNPDEEESVRRKEEVGNSLSGEISNGRRNNEGTQSSSEQIRGRRETDLPKESPNRCTDSKRKDKDLFSTENNTDSLISSAYQQQGSRVNNMLVTHRSHWDSFAEARNFARAAEIVKRIEIFYEHGFRRDFACLLLNLPFYAGPNISGHEKYFRSILAENRVLAPVRHIEFLGRKKTSAVLIFENNQGLQDMAASGCRLRVPFDKRPRSIDAIFFHRDMLLSARHATSSIIENLQKLCNSSRVSFSMSNGDGTFATVDDDLTILKLLALDGYILSGIHLNVHFPRSEVARCSLLNTSQTCPRESRSQKHAMGSDAPRVERFSDDEWRIMYDNAPFELNRDVVREQLLRKGLRGYLHVHMLKKGLFVLQGNNPDDFCDIMMLKGTLFGPSGSLRPMYLTVDIEPSQLRNAPTRLRSISQHCPHSPDRNDHRSRMYKNKVDDFEYEAPGRRELSRRQSSVYPTMGTDVVENSPDRQKENSRLLDSTSAEFRRDSDNAKAVVGDSRTLSRRWTRANESGDRRGDCSLPTRRRVAVTSGVSRGFRASPVTPSPNDFVSTLKKSERKLIDPALISVCQRTESLREDIFKGIPSPPAGTYEDFCKIISQMCEEQDLKFTVRTDDAPYAPHVWQGIASMGKGRFDAPAHCNGYLVVRRNQSDEEVRLALDMMPEVLSLEYRVGWEETRYLHLLHQRAVVLMIRSSGEIEDELTRDGGAPSTTRMTEDVRSTSNLSAIDSQKNFLGMLRNLRDKQRIGLVRYSKKGYPKLAALCVPPSAHAFEKLAIPWRFCDMVGHDTMLLVVGIPKSSKT